MPLQILWVYDALPSAQNLLDKKLLRIMGKKKVVGNPLLYGTSKQFLVHFGLDSLTDLPSIDEFDHLTVFNVARNRNDHTIRTIMLQEVAKNLFSGEGLNILGPPENRLSHGVTPPESPVEEIMNVVIRCILHHFDLLEDHGSLPLNLLCIKSGV